MELHEIEIQRELDLGTLSLFISFSFNLSSLIITYEPSFVDC